MDALKTYLKSLSEEDRTKFAADCGTTPGHLRNVMYGQRPCSPELAALIEKHSAKAVTRQHLRPQDWPDIWPELAEAKAAA